MTNNPRLSVILPVYNAEKYIESTLNSILSQTYTRFELILIDDCSTDGSLKIIEKFSDSRIRLVKNETNLKLIKTLNKGLRLAQGEYVARCDADDLYDPKRFEKQIKFLEENLEIGILGTDAWIIDQNNRILSTTVNFPYTPSEIDLRLQSGSPFFHSSVMFRKSLILESGGYDAEYVHAEDYALWLKLRKNTQYLNLKSRLLYYRIHSQSISSQNYKQQLVVSKNARDLYLKNIPIHSNYSFLKENIWINKRNSEALLKIIFHSPIRSLAVLAQLSIEVIFKFILTFFKKIASKIP